MHSLPFLARLIALAGANARSLASGPGSPPRTRSGSRGRCCRGISGAKGRDQRPGLDALLKDAGRRKFDVVMAWAIDRLGRSLVDLLGTIQHLEAVGVDLYLDQQSIDTTTPAGKLLFQMTGAFAELERSMIRQRVRAGLSVIKAKIERDGKFVSKAGKVRKRLGRPGAEADKLDRAR